MRDYSFDYFLDAIPVLLGPLAWALGYGAIVAETEWEGSDPRRYAL